MGPSGSINGQGNIFRYLYLPSADRAFAVVALGETERVRSHVASLRQIASSLEHRTPRIATSGPLADNTQAAQLWLQKLRGKTVKQFISGAGTAGERVRVLAADGTYTYRSNVAIVADVPAPARVLWDEARIPAGGEL